MAGTSDVKFYKSTSAGSKGGAITTTEIISSTFNNLFSNVTGAERIAGEDYYLCMYVKNTDTTDSMDNFNFWLDSDSPPVDSTVKWGFDLAGKNGTAQTIANIFTAPTNVQWNTASNEPIGSNVGKLLKGEYFPVWIWWHVDANASSRTDDLAVFNFSFLIPSGGTGTGTGTVLDTFGIKKFFNTKAGGLEWFSTIWANSHVRTLLKNTFDPDDPRFGFMMPVDINPTLIINGDGTATMPEDFTATPHVGHRLYVHGPWTNTEMTVYARWRTAIWSSMQLRSRANHHGTGSLPYGYDDANDLSCGFGNYEAKWGDDWIGNVTACQVEVIHAEYSINLDEHPFTLPAINTWTGFKQITRTIGGEVNVQGWVNYDITDQTAWQKVTEFTFTGTNVHIDQPGTELNISTCLNQGDKISGDLDKNTLWLNPGYWSYLRVQGGNAMDLKFFSVREIEGQVAPGDGGGGGTPPPTNTNWKMAFVGDEGCGSTTNAVRDLCKTYDYTVSVGDHAYAAASCWTSTFQSLKPNFAAAMGNHEYSESGGISPYMSFFGLSKTYYSVNFQNVHVVIIDTNINCDPGSAQHNFVSADLNAASSNNSIDWIFAVMHHPWFGASSTHSYNDANAIQAFHSLFMQHNVAFVFTGHNHNWQRSHKVAYNAGSPTNPTVIDSTPPFTNDTTGLVHVITGTGGHDSGGGLYSLGSQPAFQGYQNRTHNGIFEVVASNGGKTLTCAFVDKDGTSKFDSFVYTTT